MDMDAHTPASETYPQSNAPQHQSAWDDENLDARADAEADAPAQSAVDAVEQGEAALAARLVDVGAGKCASFRGGGDGDGRRAPGTSVGSAGRAYGGGRRCCRFG